jgi:hypothetical protein
VRPACRIKARRRPSDQAGARAGSFRCTGAKGWCPARRPTRLEFGGCLCSPEFSEFREVSENTLFAYGEGLPGKAWAAGHPIILTKLSDSGFKRADEAKEVGLTCGVALPVFAGEFLMGVLVLFCGGEAKHVGAIELWHNDPEASHEMGLVDGYYGTADMFEFNSRHTKFPRGFGLPGRVWKAGMPLIIKDVHNSKQFLRWEEATKSGDQLRSRHTLQDAFRPNLVRVGCASFTYFYSTICALRLKLQLCLVRVSKQNPKKNCHRIQIARLLTTSIGSSPV